MGEVELTVHVTNIVWNTETDDEDNDEAEYLPEEATIYLTLESDYTEDHLLEAIADYLSDEYGFLMFDYDYKIHLKRRKIVSDYYEKRYFSVSDVAIKTNVTTLTVRRWINTGRLRATKFPGKWLIEEESFNDFIMKNTR